MKPNGNDLFIKQIDNELRTIDERLKEVLSKTEAILNKSIVETQETEKTDNYDGDRSS